MTNQEFLQAVSNSFNEFISSGTSRSTAKLKPLHGAIARDIISRLGPGYTVHSQGYGDDREASINGRYVNKMVDITIKKGTKPVAGIAVKFVMQNYSQNSNNYFENMLGETANIRCGKCPYFQIFIILDKLPYYKKTGEINRWETFTDHNIAKYVMLSKDNVDVYMHTPNKTLIYVVHVPDVEGIAEDKDGYLDYFRTHGFTMRVSNHPYDDFDSAVILNDYEDFMDKVYHTILSL